MPIPRSSLLRAALRWLELRPHNSPERCQAILTNTAKYADLTPSQYYEARQWLLQHEIELAAATVGQLPAGPTVFTAAIMDAVWFSDASQVISAPEELPLDAIEAAEVCGIAEDYAYALIRHHHGLIDTARRKSVGDAGERLLAELLRTCTTCHVEHVAAWSDGYGFDISLTGTIDLHLEVKTTVKLNQNVIYLSRHEFETMVRDPLWRLVFVRLGGDGALEKICTVDTAWLLNSAPVDSVPGMVDWQSIRVNVPESQLRPGLGDIRNAIIDAELYPVGLLIS
ncbi:DUF3883 domain-containing protein [Mycolicibacter heraklionensis]|uniref:DUF3883 domain-containing protein n=1 Tax=Mycolicibacter heraklionensis TaxID=512402 RepID=A0A9X7WIX1_9MYCO|nr:DUF3883 domain-containing protein [Mycolicibacter heraklionensis]QZA08397.1 DUF3883 domain-containing protein [Mycolicibacter heraklionensis]